MDNLLRKASILLTPTAFESGRMLAIKPEVALGSEEVVNGDFATDGNWNNFGTPTTSEQSTERSYIGTYSWKIIADATREGIFSPNNFNLTSGRTYTVSLWIYSVSGNSILSGLTNTNASVFTARTVTVGEWTNITYQATATSTSASYISILSNSSLNFFIDNVSVKEDLSGDFNFTRNSEATIDNEEGLIKNVQIIGSEEVTNGNFSQEGAELITNGNFSNGAADWNIAGINISVANGKATSTGSNFGAQLKQTILQTNKIYKLTFDIVDYTSGSIGLVASYYGQEITFNSVGTHTINFTSLSQTEFRLYSKDFVGSVANISVKEVGQDWSFGTGWSISNSKANKLNGGITYLLQNLVLETSKTYKITFTVSNYVSGDVKWGFTTPSGSPFGTSRTANGTYTELFTHDSNTIALRFRAGSNFNGSVTNISIKEFADDTNLPRITYENDAGAFLLEPQSTNLITDSEGVGGFSALARLNCVYSLGNGFNSFGSSCSIDVNTFSNNKGRAVIIYNAVLGENNLFSFFIKKKSGFYLKIASGNATNSFGINLDLSDGSVLNTTENAINNTNIIQLSDDCFRVEFLTTASSTTIAGLILLNFYDNSSFLNWNNTNANLSFLISGLQLENQSFSTSYIPTSGAARTRLQDLATDSGNATLINSTEGVLYAEIAALANNGTFRYITLFGDTNNHVQIYYKDDANKVAALVRSNGNVSFIFTYTLTDATDFIKVAISYKVNDFKMYVNGVKVAADTTGNTPIGLSELDFNYNGGNHFFGKNKALAVYDEALTDEELQYLTTQ